ncbi:MAG: DUF2087 domain-containing protein [Anaerolineae bacterium]|nr:DUF2087 domain-containing protein [Anaerolineae bacterium]
MSDIIRPFFYDHATLRRELIDGRGVYCLVTP